MRIDVVSIFPEYLAPLELSLIGKARQDGLLDLSVHDLRSFTTDRHRTVDDTPYGGGAGMVMKAEPWAQALASVAAPPADAGKPVLIVPSPAGERFTQALAYELAEEDHLAFACGRYEGIDERVIEWAEEHFTVRPVSLGDYVLNGGEVAVLAMVEAIGRLLPGRGGQSRIPGGGVPLRRPARVPRLHQALRLAGTGSAGGAAQRQPRKNRAVAPA